MIYSLRRMLFTIAFAATCTALVAAESPTLTMRSTAQVGINSMNQLELKQCLDCICQASTKCIPPRQCWKADGSETLICGAYLISEQYWIDAGKPHDAEVGGFFKCAYHKICAQNTIIEYMNKHGKDCDGDGVFSCYDVGLLHHGEKDACENPWLKTTKFWSNFTECLSSGQKLDERQPDRNEKPVTF